MKLSNYLVLGFFFEAIALCLLASFRFINIESTVTLLLFNLLFLSLIVKLNGTLNRKIGILTLGNIIGLFWNFMLSFLANTGATFLGETFTVFYAVIYPFLNFMWIISFWSMSLAVLPKPKSTCTEVKP